MKEIFQIKNPTLNTYCYVVMDLCWDKAISKSRVDILDHIWIHVRNLVGEDVYNHVYDQVSDYSFDRAWSHIRGRADNESAEFPF
jgi:hypothetical protein